MEIGIFNTYINDKAFYSIIDPAIDSTMISEGKLVKEFEAKLASDLGMINPVAVNSGTSALHLAIVLAGIKVGDEVICPAQTFVATALVVTQEGGTPVFADIDYSTGNIDPKSVESKITSKTKAIIAVHWGGYPCDMDPLIDISKKYNLILIEDAAHAPGAIYKNRAIGSISDFTCFSFQAIKHLTTGDGGAICCKDTIQAKEAFVRRWFGIDRANSKPSILGEREYDISKIGFKYHLNDYAAALGLANLENFHNRLDQRRVWARSYRKHLSNIDGIKLFRESADSKSSYWLFGFHVEKREDFIKALKNKKITASVVHLGIDHNSIFGGKNYSLENQRKFDNTQINIPIHDGLNDEYVEYIIETIKKGW
jgi:perosamine synthetase